MAKNRAEQNEAFRISWLRKNGYLDKSLHYQFGGIQWTRGEYKTSIHFGIRKNTVGNPEEKERVVLEYMYADRHSGETTNINYAVALTCTLCNYDGKRYWFICPLSTNDLACGRRVGVLYRVDKYFGCRHCMRIAYTSQMYGGSYKGFVSAPDIEKAESEVKRWHYRGKPTRKYRKVIRLNEKFNDAFIKLAMRLK